MGFGHLDTRGLLSLYAHLLEEMRERELLVTANNPVADYAELLVCTAFDLERQPKENKGFDARDVRTGMRYEIKARRENPHSKPARLSPLRDFDAHHFDKLVVVLFDFEFGVKRAMMLPWESVPLCSTHSEHVNGRLVSLGETLWSAPGGVDVTRELRQAADTV